MRRLTVIVVSHNSAHWLGPCLESVSAAAGDGVRLDVIVVDSGSSDETPELVRARFPGVQLVSCPNHGFAHANNRGLEAADDPDWVLFLNPDTRILEGTFRDLLDHLDAQPSVGLVGVRQVGADERLEYSIRRFPTPLRSLMESLGSERWPLHASWLGERVTDPEEYLREADCDWTSGSFMLVRASALPAGPALDERFFLYCEEPDLCLELKRQGWRVRHVPLMTILHHGGGASDWDPRLKAQEAFARRQYTEKHFGSWERLAANAAYGLGLAIRGVLPGSSEKARRRRRASRRMLSVLVGMSPPPFPTRRGH
jgi:GT2 family glycosyltransferase